MIYLYGAVGFLVAAILRHLQGGLDNALGIKRAEVVVLYSLLGIPAYIVYWNTPWFNVEYLGILRASIILALLYLDMLLTQDMNKPWKVLWRYGTGPVILAFLTGFYWAALAGVISAIISWAMHKWGKSIPLLLPYYDGIGAGMELLLGGVAGLFWVISPLIGGPVLFG